MKYELGLSFCRTSTADAHRSLAAMELGSICMGAGGGGEGDRRVARGRAAGSRPASRGRGGVHCAVRRQSAQGSGLLTTRWRLAHA